MKCGNFYEVNHVSAKYGFINFKPIMIGLKDTAETIHLPQTQKAGRATVDSYIKPEVLFEFAGQGIIINAGCRWVGPGLPVVKERFFISFKIARVGYWL
jgi:hypothetical protein